MTASASEDAEFSVFRKEHGALSEVDCLRRFSEQLFHQGRFVEAKIYAHRVIEYEQAAAQHVEELDIRRLEAHAYAAGDHALALASVLPLIEQGLASEDDLVHAGLYCMLQNKLDEAEAFYLEAFEANNDLAQACDALAHLYGLRGDREKVKRFGNRALKLKSAEATAEDNLAKLNAIIGANHKPTGKPARFNPTEPDKNIISFSLWGDNPDYTDGAILNASIAHIIYPGWTCRFYCDDSVPQHVIAKLEQLNAQVRMIEGKSPAFLGLFWRFFVADDSSVDRYLIRDCDCLLNCQERAAVDEWIRSGKHFHIMRDYASHTELMHAGMWGGVQGAIPKMSELIVDYYDNHNKGRTMDQHFLRYCIWPIARHSQVTHDSIYKFANAQSFPVLGRYPPHTGNVGMHWRSLYAQRDVKPLLNF